ncbi:unnamed protein product [Ixodes hexagonus]
MLRRMRTSLSSSWDVVVTTCSWPSGPMVLVVRVVITLRETNTPESSKADSSSINCYSLSAVLPDVTVVCVVLRIT